MTKKDAIIIVEELTFVGSYSKLDFNDHTIL